MNDNMMKCVLENSFLDNITNISTLIISFINLVFVIWIYFKEKKEKKEIKIKEYKYDWYKMISVKDRIKNLNMILNDVKKNTSRIFNSAKTAIDERNALMNQALIDVNDALFNEKNNYTYLLKCISESDNIDVTKLYNDFQEEYYSIFTKAVAKQEYSFDKLIDIFSKISNKYYEIGIDLIK